MAITFDPEIEYSAAQASHLINKICENKLSSNFFSSNILTEILLYFFTRHITTNQENREKSYKRTRYRFSLYATKKFSLL